MPPMVQIRHLRKEYKELVAVKDLSLDLDAGDIFGFIGPNGAGKTTTIKMLSTLLTPTAGMALIDGVDVVRYPEAVRAIIGYMPDFFGVYDDIKVWEYLDFFAAAYRIPRQQRPQIIDEVLELTDLNVKKDSYVESLSRGMKQRLCLAKTLVHDPKVLLLDEPASGLDPRARIEIKELIKTLGVEMKKTIIISSHILPELADFCNKIGIIEKGEMIVAGNVNEIIRQVSGHHVLEIHVLSDGLAAAAPAEVGASVGPASHEGGVAVQSCAAVDRAMEILQGLPDISGVSLDGPMIQAQYVGEPNEEWQVLRALVQSDVKVLSFGMQDTDLEDVFMRVTKGIVS